MVYIIMSIKKKIPAEVHSEEHYGCTINVWRPEVHQSRTFAWRYSIELNGVVHEYHGIANQMKNKQEALSRARWKAQCLALACKPVNPTAGMMRLAG